MRFLTRILILALLASCGYYAFLYFKPVEHPDGVLVSQAPLQSRVLSSEPWNYKGARITPVASFALDARVLSAKRYADAWGNVAPYDLALGWQSMSDSAVLRRLDISQFMRYYYYEWKGKAPLAPVRIIEQSANMHIIPANDEVRRALSHVKEGDLISLRGKLVNVTKDGVIRRSSTTRTDSGEGACEIIWVEVLLVGER